MRPGGYVLHGCILVEFTCFINVRLGGNIENGCDVWHMTAKPQWLKADRPASHVFLLVSGSPHQLRPALVLWHH